LEEKRKIERKGCTSCGAFCSNIDFFFCFVQFFVFSFRFLYFLTVESYMMRVLAVALFVAAFGGSYGCLFVKTFGVCSSN
jgi:hypothetical protein